MADYVNRHEGERSLLDATCRVALAGLLHDLGKLAERADMPVPNREFLEVNKQIYCPHPKPYPDSPGWFSHVHAAYTALALDAIERELPPIKGEDASPFQEWGEARAGGADDSLINAAAKHHKPDTFLQWIVATADRAASGLDREQLDQYNNTFASGGETTKHAAKLLRGRSFFVTLLTECAALRMLDGLSLPPTSQIVNAAGKFQIIAPNTPKTIDALRELREELDEWFLRHTFGQSGVGIAWTPATCNDLQEGSREDSPYRELITRLFEALEDAKLRRFGLCSESAPSPVFEGYLESIREHGLCTVDGRSPADGEEAGSDGLSRLACDQVTIGGLLTKEIRNRLLVTRRPLDGHNVDFLDTDMFGYHIGFTGDEEASGRFGNDAASGNLLRAWDFSLPEEDDEEPLFYGYARRDINARVPRFSEADLADTSRYEGVPVEDSGDPVVGGIKPFNHLAREARVRRSSDHGPGTDPEPYASDEFRYRGGARLELHILHDAQRLSADTLLAAMSDIGAVGYGRDASVGLGRFKVLDAVANGQRTALPEQDDANAWLTLAPVAPQGLGLSPERSWYRPMTRFARHGDRAVSLGKPFKAPLLLADTGAVLSPSDGRIYTRPFVGRGLGGAGNPISLVLPETVHQGYAPVLGIRVPEIEVEDGTNPG